MKRFLLIAAAVTFIMMSAQTSMAQTNEYSLRWLEAAGPAPELKIPATSKAWEKQRVQIRKELWELLGKLPPRPKVPKVETVSREDRGDYLLEKFQFDNGAGAMVPGYILLPKSSGKKHPAILYNHWHGGEYDQGKAELFHQKHTPELPGPTLAKRGYVVLCIDAYCFGERNDQQPSGLMPSASNAAMTAKQMGAARELTASKFNLWFGRCLWGMMLRDDLMALDYLCSRPEVDTKNIGVTGMSMGATRSWWLMALDDRIKTGVPVACFTRYQNLMQHDALPAHGIYYFVPGMLAHFDTEAVVACIAPRPVLFMTGGADAGSPVDGIHFIESKVGQVYDLYNSRKDFESDVIPGLGHVYQPEMWEKMLKWMDAHLSNR